MSLVESSDPKDLPNHVWKGIQDEGESAKRLVNEIAVEAYHAGYSDGEDACHRLLLTRVENLVKDGHKSLQVLVDLMKREAEDKL